MNIALEKYEELHDIKCGGLKLIQNVHGFRYGTDAVLLSDFVILKNGERVLDFCTGSGIIPLLLLARNKAKEICGIEIEEEIVRTAVKTAKLNNAEDKLKFICGDIKNASKIVDGSFDVITCNPPYSKSGSGMMSESNKIARARYEVDCTLNDVVKSAAKVLKFGGRFYIVHKAERLVDIVCTLREYRLEPKELQFVHTKPGKKAELVMICAVLGGGVQINVLPPITLADGGII